MSKFNVGIIGYSWVATAHIAAINASESAQVTALWSSREHDDGALSDLYGTDITSYTDLGQMLADKSIDVVSVCSYNNQHKEQVCLLYTSPSPRDGLLSRMPSS